MNKTIFNIDNLIVAFYMVFSLAVGLRSAGKVHTMQAYALGRLKQGNFYTTLMLVTTLVATVFGGGLTVGDAGDNFRYGIGYTLACLLPCLGLVGVAYSALPRIQSLLQQRDLARDVFLSPGDFMYLFYGKAGRVVTGLCGALLSAAYTAVQMTAITFVFQYFFDLAPFWGLCIAYAVVVLYTAWGGMQSVIATDVLQFFILAASVLILLHTALGGVHLMAPSLRAGIVQFFKAMPQSHLGLVPPGMGLPDYLALLGVSAVLPFLLDPAQIQRLILIRQPQQVKASLCLAAFIIGLLSLAIAFVAFSCLITDPSVSPDFALLHTLGAYVPPVFKGIAIAGLFAAIMSTADSYLNIAGVTLTRDFIKPVFLPRLTDAKELRLARLSTFAIGTLGLLGALTSQRILSLGMAACACWAPVVVVPLWAGLLGYRASGRTFLVAVGAGQAAFWLWSWHFDSGPGGMIAIIPAMVANAAAFALARRWDGPASPQGHASNLPRSATASLSSAASLCAAPTAPACAPTAVAVSSSFACLSSLATTTAPAASMAAPAPLSLPACMPGQPFPSLYNHAQLY